LIVKKESQYFELNEEVVNRENKKCVGKIMGKGVGICCFVFFRKMNIKFILINNHLVSKEFLKSKNKIMIEMIK